MADETRRFRPANFRILEDLEAMQWRPDVPEAVGALVGWLASWSVRSWHPGGSGARTKLALAGAEKDFFAEPRDWVLRGLGGGFFTVADAEFRVLYEPAGAGDERVRAAVAAEQARIIRLLTTGPAGEHLYVSTGCLHEDHAYCKGMTGVAGVKRPSTCKGCGAACLCCSSEVSGG